MPLPCWGTCRHWDTAMWSSPGSGVPGGVSWLRWRRRSAPAVAMPSLRSLNERCSCVRLPPRLCLVLGVMTPTEVQRACSWGARLVKLFPAISLGLCYWLRLRDPLGGELPFAIAAGGLGPADVRPWLLADVDAVALGSALLDPEPLRTLIATLPGTSLPVAMPCCRSESAVLPMRQRLPADVSTHDSAQR
jgi:hypothetical protein